MPDRHQHDDTVLHAGSHHDQPVVVERGPGEAIVEALPLPPAPEVTSPATEPPAPIRHGHSPWAIIWFKLRRN